MGIEESRKKLEQVREEIMNRRGGRLLVPPENRKKASDLRLPMKKASLMVWKKGKREVVEVEYPVSE